MVVNNDNTNLQSTIAYKWLSQCVEGDINRLSMSFVFHYCSQPRCISCILPKAKVLASVNWKKSMWHVHWPIVKRYINTASTMFGLWSSLIEQLWQQHKPRVSMKATSGCKKLLIISLPPKIETHWSVNVCGDILWIIQWPCNEIITYSMWGHSLFKNTRNNITTSWTWVSMKH